MLASALETLQITENRYSGIPIIKKELERFDMPPVQLEDKRGSFTVIFYKKDAASKIDNYSENNRRMELLQFCEQPRSRDEIANFLGIKTKGYAIQRYVKPLLDEGKLAMTIPAKPKNRNQKYVTRLLHE